MRGPAGPVRHNTESNGCGTRFAQTVLAKMSDSVLRLSHAQGGKFYKRFGAYVDLAVHCPKHLLGLNCDQMEQKTSPIRNHFNKKHFLTFRRLRLIWPIVFLGFIAFAMLGASEGLLALYFL